MSFVVSTLEESQNYEVMKKRIRLRSVNLESLLKEEQFSQKVTKFFIKNLDQHEFGFIVS